ncbi:MAG: hypothetical protein OEW06_04170, partial [Gemmatimonadota bacterium]|nr:hypothetical protein [Gemmatimonadota bacterium]
AWSSGESGRPTGAPLRFRRVVPPLIPGTPNGVVIGRIGATHRVAPTVTVHRSRRSIESADPPIGAPT